MSSKGGGGPLIAAGAVLAVPFAVVPAALLLLSNSDDDSAASTACGPDGAAQAFTVKGDLPKVDGYNEKQLKCAAIIMKVAADHDLSYQAQLIGIMTAIQESTLGLNTQPTGDGHDAGTFQQRTLPGWYGTAHQVADVAYAATTFFFGHDVTYSGPEAAGPVGYHLPGLRDIDGWESMSPGKAAQAVQGSAYPDAYDERKDDAEKIISALSGVDVTSTGKDATSCTPGSVASGDVKKVIDRGRSIMGTPYDFGGGSQDGPGPAGIDCSAFVAYAWTAAGYTDLPRTAQEQYDALASHPVAVKDVKPGDLIYEAWDRRGARGSASAVSHVTMYIGDNQVIEASRTANEVKTSPARFDSDAFVGIRRIPLKTKKGD